MKQLLIAASSDSKPGNRCCSTCRVYPWRVIIRQEGFGERGGAFTDYLLPSSFSFSSFSFTTCVPSTLLCFLLCLPVLPLHSLLSSLPSPPLTKSRLFDLQHRKNQQPPLCHQKHLFGCYGYSLRYNYYSNAVSEATGRKWLSMSPGGDAQNTHATCIHTALFHVGVSGRTLQWMRALYITSQNIVT